MDVKEAYSICYSCTDRKIMFTHEFGNLIFEGKITKLNVDECKLYYPYTVEVLAIARLKFGEDAWKITDHIVRRYKNIEDAILHIFNGFNENAMIPNKYPSIENIFCK